MSYCLSRSLLLETSFIALLQLSLLAQPPAGIAAQGQESSASQMPATLSVEQIRELKSEIQRLEAQIKLNPENLEAREQLLMDYMAIFTSAPLTEGLKNVRRHELWFIEHHPESPSAAVGGLMLQPMIDPEGYAAAKKLWMQQLDSHPDDAAILSNAGQFFLMSDRTLAENLLAKAVQLAPDNPEYSRRLAQLYLIESKTAETDQARTALAKRALEAHEAPARDASGEERFYALAELSRAAFESGDSEKAEAYATEYLKMAPQYKTNWNYGNAIHHANLILGRIRLGEGNIQAAKEFLLAAGRTPGSPQLDSFGPNMSLAKELLEQGEKETVLEYFQLCAKFWKMGGEQLKSWAEAVRRGSVPNFGSNMRY